MAVLTDLIKAISSLPASQRLTEDTVRSLSGHLPENFTFADLVDTVQDLKQTVSHLYLPPSCATGRLGKRASADHEMSALQNPKASLWATLVCLRNRDRIRLQPDTDDGHISSLCDYASDAIAPRSRSEGDQDADAAASDYDEAVRRSRELAPCGLEVLRTLGDEFHAALGDDALLTAVAFADASWPGPSPGSAAPAGGAREPFPWTTGETSGVARRALELQLARRRPEEDLLVETVLKGYLRPLFSRSGPRTVTASGRKAEFTDEDDAHRGLRDESKEAKPWKYVDHRALAVFQWTVETAQESLVRRQWPLFTPVLTALLADGETRVRLRGLHCLRLFLDRLPGDILRSTGLDDVFGHAVFPTLHYLPRLTPVDESARILTAAYAALRTLSQKVGARDQQLLDKILRDAIFSAYFHAKEYPRIVVILAEQTGWVVEAMGMNAVKHLKDLIPMFSEIMTEPFTSRAPHDMSKTVNSLQVIIRNCWPRLASTPAYQDEIIKALVTCYLNMHDDDQGPGAGTGEVPLAMAASVLSRAMTSGGGEGTTLADKVAPLLAREPLLADLFQYI